MDDEHIASAQVALDNLAEVTEYLQERAESDGLLLSLRRAGQQAGLRSDQLADQIIESAEYLGVVMPRREYWDKDPNMSLELLRAWCDHERILYAEEALAFFLQSAGLTLKKAQRGQLFKRSQFCRAFETIEEAPINL